MAVNQHLNFKRFTQVLLLGSALTLTACGGSKEEAPVRSKPTDLTEDNFNVLQEQITAYQNHTNNEITRIVQLLEQQIQQTNDRIPALNEQVQQQLVEHNKMVQKQMQEVVDTLQGQIKQLHGEIEQIKANR